jgi:hypothetical protein
MPQQNAAYKLLRELGMRPAIARHFLVGLRKKGFILVEEKKLKTATKINRQIEIIIKLMKAKRRMK